MAQTHFNLEREYLINHYRSKPIIGGYLLTNDFGFWVYLSREEFDLLRHDKLGQNQALFSLLKDKGFIFAESNSEKLINEFRQRARYLFRGAYHHVILLDNADLELIDINENMIKIANFASQTPSKEIILEFKGAVVDNFHIVKKFVDLFKAKTEKKIMYRVEANLGNANKDVLDFLIDNRFDVWVPLKNLDLSEEIYNSIKELQRRHNLNFYLDVSDEILGEEQKIIDFFAGSNFNSFFIRKTNEVSKDNFLDFWKRIMDLVYETNKKSRRVVIQELFSSILLRKITSINDVFYPDFTCCSNKDCEHGKCIDGICMGPKYYPIADNPLSRGNFKILIVRTSDTKGVTTQDLN